MLHVEDRVLYTERFLNKGEKAERQRCHFVTEVKSASCFFVSSFVWLAQQSFAMPLNEKMIDHVVPFWEHPLTL